MKNKGSIIFISGLIIGLLAMYLFKTYKIEKRATANQNIEVVSEKNSEEQKSKNYNEYSSAKSNKNYNNTIDELTSEDIVIDFVKHNKKLPDYYITKNEAKQQGWIASKSNLCEVLPGKAIGGDQFSNREKQLPKGEQYYEADVNYTCGRRNADRIVFTKKGDVWLTHNHYKTFQKQ